MIAFLTSFRARALAKDWAYHVWLLEQTVRSMLAQTAGEVRVFIGCHDLPEAGFRTDPRVECVQVRCNPPARNNDDMCADKVLKLSAAAERALREGCEYVVFNDADDLVSNRLAAFVECNRGRPGWYCGDEMFYTYGSRLLLLHELPGKGAGPCVAVRADLMEFVRPPFAGPWVELLERGGESLFLKMLARHGLPVLPLAAVGHMNFRALAALNGHTLSRLPFPGNVVIKHVDSTSTVAGGLGSGGGSQPTSLRGTISRLRLTLKRLGRLRPMSRALRGEFSIPELDAIPAPYAKGGLVLWR